MANQVGKTTLVEQVLKADDRRILRINADEIIYRDNLGSQDARQLRDLVQGYDLVFIDEAQRVADIGVGLKIVTDQLPQVRMIVTGSCSLDLAGKIREPLTGRTWTFNLHPIGQCELATFRSPGELRYQLDERLAHGAYPEMFSLEGERLRRAYLNELVAGYLYKDVLSMGLIRNSDKLRALLQLLAQQTRSFKFAYPDVRFHTITPENFTEFLA